MWGDYTGEIGEGKGVCSGRGPGGIPVGCPRWTGGGKGLISQGKGCGRQGFVKGVVNAPETAADL